MASQKRKRARERSSYSREFAERLKPGTYELLRVNQFDIDRYGETDRVKLLATTYAETEIEARRIFIAKYTHWCNPVSLGKLQVQINYIGQ